MEEKEKIHEEVVRLAKIAMSGRDNDVLLYIRRLTKKYSKIYPSMSEDLLKLLKENPNKISPLRKNGISSLPIDLDSRLQLINIDTHPEPEITPVFSEDLFTELNQIIFERSERSKLMKAGLEPTKSVLFTGAPGVGKTLAAHWLASMLKVPLLTLNLSAVMSSFLGRTGNNLRQVLDYAKDIECVLLIDELDAIAKRRDDITDVGELKRLVTVLLQEIDQWPSLGLIVSATNHSDLLDPAVWRRFERVIEFPMPHQDSIAIAIERFFGLIPDGSSKWVMALTIALEGLSFSDIERYIMNVRRSSTLKGEEIEEQFLSVIRRRVEELDHKRRVDLAVKLVDNEALSQRQAFELTGISRDTIRKRIKEFDS